MWATAVSNMPWVDRSEMVLHGMQRTGVLYKVPAVGSAQLYMIIIVIIKHLLKPD